MHLYDKDVNFFSSGIIAEGMGPGAGMALARKLQGKPGIAVAYVGDGAANQGAFHEVLNMVGLWKLPFICVIEDNKYGVSVHKKDSTAIDRNSDRASSYAMAGEFVAGNDPDLIFEAAGRAVERARSGQGGTILELETERLHGHFIGDSGGYRPEAERKAMKDPIPSYRQRLVSEKLVTESEMAALESKVQTEVDEAMQFGRDSAYPDATEALERLYA
jgi:pyruvate dehydrogenase E1 component alpha subunit